MSTDRSEGRASLCPLEFVDGRHCRIPHALSRTQECPQLQSPLWFTSQTLDTRGLGGTPQESRGLVSEGANEGMAVVANRDVNKRFRSSTYS